MYLDSGSGSMIATAIVAGAAGAGVVAKTYWGKVTGGFRKNKDSATDTQGATDTEQQ